MEEKRISDIKDSQDESAYPIQGPEEINLYSYYLVVKKRWKLVLFLVLVSTGAALVSAFLMTKTYRAETTILPVQRGSPGGTASVLGQLSELPMVGSMLPSTSADKLMNVLDSRTLREKIIRRLDLKDALSSQSWVQRILKSPRPPSLQEAIDRLGGITHVKMDMRGDLIRVSVEFRDPKMAARIANLYPAELQTFLNENALSIAKRARIFLAERYEEARKQLGETEEALRDFQTKHMLVSVDEQTEAAVRALSELKAQLVAKEVELSVFQRFVTETNPNLVRIRDEIEGLRKQVASMESRAGNPEVNVFPAFNQAPTLGLEHMRLKRDMLIDQRIFELLTQQYEMARIDEAREEVTFQVIDEAVPPEKRFKPKRRMIVLLTGVVAVFFGVFLTFLLEHLEKTKSRHA
jgi:uncharacterized protein involved in exopolysaccharide biosynthesis